MPGNCAAWTRIAGPLQFLASSDGVWNEVPAAALLQVMQPMDLAGIFDVIVAENMRSRLPPLALEGEMMSYWDVAIKQDCCGTMAAVTVS